MVHPAVFTKLNFQQNENNNDGDDDDDDDDDDSTASLEIITSPRRVLEGYFGL